MPEPDIMNHANTDESPDAETVHATDGISVSLTNTRLTTDNKDSSVLIENGHREAGLNEMTTSKMTLFYNVNEIPPVGVMVSVALQVK